MNSYDYLLEDIKEWIIGTLKDADISESEFRLLKICAYGSRVNGTASEVSDLDILVEYEGNAREDSLFDILNKEHPVFDGMLLDINPIKADKSGTLEEYLARCNNNWKEEVIVRHRRR